MASLPTIFISFEEIIKKYHSLLEIMVSTKDEADEWGFSADEVRYEVCKFTISVLEILTRMPEDDFDVLENKWASIVFLIVKYSLIHLRRFDVATTLAMGMSLKYRSRLIHQIFRRFKEDPELVGFGTHLLLLIRTEHGFSKNLLY